MCSQTMHSKRKVKKYYPQINQTVVRMLYGSGVRRDKKKNWRTGTIIIILLQVTNSERLRCRN